jgi:hypothetical protein
MFWSCEACWLWLSAADASWHQAWWSPDAKLLCTSCAKARTTRTACRREAGQWSTTAATAASAAASATGIDISMILCHVLYVYGVLSHLHSYWFERYFPDIGFFIMNLVGRVYECIY